MCVAGDIFSILHVESVGTSHRVVINRVTIRVVAAVVLAVVIFVFVAPLIDLEPSALRAQQFAQMFLAVLVSGAFLLAGLSEKLRLVSSAVAVLPGSVSVQDLICVWLC